MIKTPLESLLETGFSELKVEFGRRIYGEEVAAGASVDDVLGEQSIEEHNRHLEEASYHLSKEEFRIEYGASMMRLTDEQRECDGDMNPAFFKRMSGNYRNWTVAYSVRSEEVLPCYEREADRLIAKGGLFENLQLSYNDLGVIGIEINGSTKRPNTVRFSGWNLKPRDEPDFAREVRKQLESKKEALAALESLDDKVFNPADVYQAVMAFLKA